MVARRDETKVRASDNARYYRNWEKRRAASAEYQRHHQGEVAEAKRQWALRNPEKRKAQHAANNALRDGRLSRQPCEQAGNDCRGVVQKHHDDYSKPLEVRWLCIAHHNEHHRKKRGQ